MREKKERVILITVTSGMIDFPDTSTAIYSFPIHQEKPLLSENIRFVPVVISAQGPTKQAVDLYDLNKRLRGNKSPLPGETNIPDDSETTAG